MSKRNGRQSENISEESVLAENFVPEHLRRINQWHVTAPMFASRRDTISSFGPNGLVVPFVPICYCDGVDTKRVFMGEHLHCFPVHRTIQSSLYFAIQHRADLLSKGPTSNGDATESETVKESIEQEQHPPHSVKTMDIVSGLDEYVQIWESILELERFDVLLKYERFSQYSKTITHIVPEERFKARTDRIENGAPPDDKPHDSVVAKIEIQGIADVSPPLMIGDIVLVRPMQPLSLPVPNQRHQSSLANFQWSQPTFVVEIQCNVLQVQRGIGDKKDTVRISWLRRFEAEMIAYSIKSINRIPERFNIRFVPSAMVHRLDWLMGCFHDRPASSAVFEFLFPTAAPSDFSVLSPEETSLDGILAHSKQLNNIQSSFVKMVLTRTLQPSNGPIRGPMVLTGPAGTGMFMLYDCDTRKIDVIVLWLLSLMIGLYVLSKEKQKRCYVQSMLF
jgi:hypothetical protein